MENVFSVFVFWGGGGEGTGGVRTTCIYMCIFIYIYIFFFIVGSKHIGSKNMEDIWNTYPDAQCMAYLPTFG